MQFAGNIKSTNWCRVFRPKGFKFLKSRTRISYIKRVCEEDANINGVYRRLNPVIQRVTKMKKGKWPVTSPPEIFDRRRYKLKILRAKRLNAPDADFLMKHAAKEIADRLSVINREFAKTVDIGWYGKHGTESINQCKNVGPVVLDPLQDSEILGPQTHNCDLILSCFGLHWVNDLPGVLHQIRRALKPDGLFMAVLPAQGTLHELSDCFIRAEIETKGGAGMRFDPFLEVRQVGDLMTRAGFTLPVTDVEEVTVRYNQIGKLISDLRAMAATSSLASNQANLAKNTFNLAKRKYEENYSDHDGKIRATFRFVFLSGWAPHESQQKPIARGSAKFSLKDALET